MKIDDLLSNLNIKLSNSDEAEAASKNAPSENRPFLEEVVARLTPTVSSYETKLKERNIQVEVQSYPTGISFTLRYKDCGYRALNIRTAAIKIAARPFHT